VRNELYRLAWSKRTKGITGFTCPRSTEELLVTGYSQILRPKLILGRFRSPERDISDFLQRLPAALERSPPAFAVTGGPAAELIQHFYRGPELPLFLRDSSPTVQQRLRLLPDRQGPIVILRAFGEMVFGRKYPPPAGARMADLHGTPQCGRSAGARGSRGIPKRLPTRMIVFSPAQIEISGPSRDLLRAPG